MLNLLGIIKHFENVIGPLKRKWNILSNKIQYITRVSVYYNLNSTQILKSIVSG
jgi:hypothetical protein